MVIPVQQHSSFPLRLFATSFAISLLIAIFGGWQSWQMHNRFAGMSARHVALTETVGRIMLLDEALTMSARMAAASGDFSYEKRYDQFDAQLTTQINKVRAILPQAEIAGFVGETDEANTALVKMERQAFTLSHQGRRPEAMALLASDEYMRLKKIYAGGMEKTVESATGLIERENQALDALSYELAAAGVAGGLVLLATWFVAIRSARSWDEERREAADSLRRAHDELEVRVVQRTQELSSNNESLQREIAVRTAADEKILRLNQLYAALSQCNRAIVHCTSDDELFAKICEVAVQSGGFKMAWIGIVDEFQVVPVASYGDGVEYLDGIQISTSADVSSGSGPTGTSIRENQPFWCQDFLNDLATEPWHERAIRFGWGASASLPLHRNGQVAGAFTVYAAMANAFDEAARSLLLEMSVDIDFALDNYAREVARQKAGKEIDRLAHFDQLTGLRNRTSFAELSQQALRIAQRNRSQLAILFLDLDHFKDINDTLGHSIGDALLIELSKRLRRVLRDVDTLSRWGGDEFILLLPGTDARGAAQVAQKLLEVTSRPYQIEQYDLNATASIGISLYPEDGTTLETLSSSADTAMYRVKQEGRHGFQFFTQEMQDKATRNLQLVNALRHALELNQFQLHYQPQVAMQSGRIIGAEALLRWQHPELGAVSPAEFIPVAEDNGLILPIGEWVMRTAVQQAKIWLARGLEPMIVAVNLSAVQFRHPDLPELVTRILDEAGLPAANLELELTEGVAMHDPLGAIAVMNDLYERGIRTSINDFGTGYSSLSYLKKFKVYKLKIDQSFLRDISDDPEDQAIVGAIISLADSLGMQTIAEGVETLNQLALLRAQGCDEVQGYYYSKPLPAELFEAYVRSRIS